MNTLSEVPLVLERIAKAEEAGDTATAKSINQKELTPLLHRALGLKQREVPAQTQLGQFIDQTRNMALNLASDLYDANERRELLREVYERLQTIKEQIGYSAVLNV